MKKIIVLILFSLLVVSCSTTPSIDSNTPQRQIASEEKCTTLLSRLLANLPSKESARAFVARTYKRFVIDPKVVNLQGTIYKMTDGNGNPIEFELGKKLGHGYNGSVYKLINQSGVIPPDDSRSFPYVVKMSNRYKDEKDLFKSGKHDHSLNNEFEVEDFFRAKTSDLWKTPELEAFKETWKSPKLPIAIAYKRLKSDNGVFLIKPLVVGMFLSDIAKQHGTRSSDLPREMRESLKEIYTFAQIIHKKVIVPGKITGKPQDQGFSLDLKPENLVWVHEPKAMEFFGLKKPGFVFVEFSHYAGGDWAYHENKVSFETYFQVFLEYLKAAN